ncbi:tRNA 2-thiouridine(34) synthase MnmA [Silanimonas sp.]|uniref:tRNA 2-thiouridine(34) synthase MnmA n=1 Tax=Silanimonas sp. TaxID=1929290 RepID=UPI001BC41C30|nr:tRNA 2-thiouridine(34) synthase MnmA [Silanimonas sp.]MBS3896256.1 tRNA 2-thiouridine(34) synthase MnmA [Silanimonas sp.]
MSESPDIMVGVSGGVDSSVAAWCLRESGSRVAGLFMTNWADEGSGECRAEADRRDALKVCAQLGLPFIARDFSAEYRSEVFAAFLAEYRAGRTPNPDVLCNREIKFKCFLDEARALGARRIATGHYARIDQGEEGWRLLRGDDAGKDQSYFLHQLGQEQLAATLFPIGGLAKTEVRAIAARLGLATAKKKDSTGICFIGERDFRAFLARYVAISPGEIVDPQGRVIGQHAGIAFHTLGQREGLGIGGVRGRPEAPWFVVGKDVAHNRLIVDQGDSPLLHSTRLRSETMHWIAGHAPAFPLRCEAQVRHRQAPQACTVQPTADGGVELRFDQAQRAVTPGQSVVLYRGELCLGGALIAATDAPLDPNRLPAA